MLELTTIQYPFVNNQLNSLSTQKSLQHINVTHNLFEPIVYNWLVLNYDAHAFFQLPSRDILFEETHDIFPFVVGNKLSTFFTGLPRFHSNAARDGFALVG